MFVVCFVAITETLYVFSEHFSHIDEVGN